MTNEQKVKNMTKGFLKEGLIKKSRLQELLIKAMEWKDKQFINKAMKVICNSCAQKVECEFNNWKTCSSKDELIKSIERE